MVATEGQRRVNPCVYLRPTAQPISRRPAATRNNHFMFDSSRREGSSPEGMQGHEVVLSPLAARILPTRRREGESGFRRLRALRQRHELAVFGPHVVGGRTDDLPVL